MTTDCKCNEYTMLPVRGFGLAVDTSAFCIIEYTCTDR